MSELDKIKAEGAFYAEIGPLQEEFEAAREVKKEDPERWYEAKQAFEEKRTYWRSIGEAIHALAAADDSDVKVTTDTVAADSKTISPVGGKK